MKCTKPVWIQDKDTAGGLSVPCGVCLQCRLTYAHKWSIRLMHEKRMNQKSVFATLTYNDENLPEDNLLDKGQAQLFLKRLRGAMHRDGKRKLRHYLVGEYGEGNGRPHYHAILFGLDRSENDKRILRDSWGLGHVHTGTVTDDSCTYCAKYITFKHGGHKGDLQDFPPQGKEFALMSKRPGIGASFIEKYGADIKARGTVIVKGKEVGIPKYYVNKLFVDDHDKAKREDELREERKKHFQEVIDKVRKIGYNESDKVELSQRRALEDRVNARSKMKKRRCL